MSLSEEDLDRIETEASAEAALDDEALPRDGSWPFEPDDVLALVAEVRRLRANPLLAATCPECSQPIEDHIAYQDGYVVFLCEGVHQGPSGILLRLADARAEPRADASVDTDTGRWEREIEDAWAIVDERGCSRLFRTDGVWRVIDDAGSRGGAGLTADDLRAAANIIEREQA